jgi:hypothetical protein
VSGKCCHYLQGKGCLKIPVEVIVLCLYVSLSVFCCRYAGRFDCGCIYEMECELLNQKRVPVTNFRCYETVKQWEGAAWHKVSSVLNVWAASLLSCICYGDSTYPTL